ncbi:hypothetical protein EYS14_06500 [Alteromonadaceae bacterium M269]|nr:hypothetical protein EYS14_06500 [Alteromonadaceae bacterium M269]
MKKFIVFLILWTALSACDKPNHINPIKQYGLELSDKALGVASKSIWEVNQLLGREELYLYSGELKEAGTALVWVNQGYLSFTPTDMMFVLRECRCIVVQADAFSEWMKPYGLLGQLSDQGILSGTDVLNYFVLHELGHLTNGHEGRAINADSTIFNRETTTSKLNEEAADLFAANIIKNISNDDLDVKTLASSIQLKLGMLAFDLQGARIINNFGCSATNAPCAFHDTGDTHPNFEYRVLRVNCYMDEQNCEAFEDFKRRRESNGMFGDGILYRADGL